MRITKVNIPKSVDKIDGLEEIKMDRLGQIVLITGKNGSGKTRILKKINETISRKPDLRTVNDYTNYIEKEETNISNNKKQIKNLENVINTQFHPEEYIQSVKLSIENLKNQINEIKLNIISYKDQINFTLVETNEISEYYQLVYFVPKSLNLKDCNNLTKNEIVTKANGVNQTGVDNLPDGVLAKIQIVQDRFMEATHTITEISEIEKSKAIEDYEKLNNIIKTFIGEKLSRDVNGNATLFGFPLGKSNLSDGQKILLQFCLAIYSQEVNLKDLIIILDEPENHLHPSVIIETIERIQKCVTNGQIWIATHSIPLLAHFDPSMIWFVEENTIKHAGKIPEKVLSSLLGDENEIAKLQDFISLPSQYASSRYAFESLFEPMAVNTNSNDPQSLQVRQDLLKLSSNGKLRILDYGVGKGRLISNLTDIDENNLEKLIEKIDYIAYDKFSNDKEQCQNAIAKAFGKSENRYFNDYDKLITTYDKSTFDVIIMCNVLHEIDPKEWLQLFEPNGTITSLLSENGILLLVEDHQIPIGEKAYQKGFLVMDTPQLKELFKITEKDKDFTFTDFRDNGKLKAHQIPKRCLSNIDSNTRTSALKSMSITARNKILEIRELDKNYQNGKLHGFWTQQFANAQLNLAEFTT